MTGHWRNLSYANHTTRHIQTVQPYIYKPYNKTHADHKPDMNKQDNQTYTDHTTRHIQTIQLEVSSDIYHVFSKVSTFSHAETNQYLHFSVSIL